MASKLTRSTTRFSKAAEAKSRRRPLVTKIKVKQAALASSTPVLESEVQAFCDEYGLGQSLAVMLELFQNHLHPVGLPEISLGSDPENFEQYIVVTVNMSGQQEEILDAYERYIRRWVTAVSWQQAAWFRLFYIPNQ